MNLIQKKATKVLCFLTLCLFSSAAFGLCDKGVMVNTDAGSLDFGFITYIEKIPGLAQHLKGVSTSSATFVLDNQSEWVTPDIDLIKNWKHEDDLYLTQNQAIFSTHRFAIVNPRLQKAIPISLVKEPLPAENKMFFITKIDIANDVVVLDSGVEFAVYSHDHGTFKKFNNHDRVLIGYNSSDRLDDTSSQCHKGYLLINTTCNSYVRVSPIR